jgi:hypothetical protein
VTAYATSARQFIDARGHVFVKIANLPESLFRFQASASSNFSAVLPEKIALLGSRPY